MGEALLVELDQALVDGLLIQMEDIYDLATEVTERCCDDPEVATIVHDLRNLRAAKQLFQGQSADALSGEEALTAEDVHAFTDTGAVLLNRADEALSRKIAETEVSARLEDQPGGEVDASLVTAHEQIVEQIAALSAQLASVTEKDLMEEDGAKTETASDSPAPPAKAVPMPPSPLDKKGLKKGKRIKSTAPRKALPVLDDPDDDMT